MAEPLKIGVLLSGSGTNLQAIIDAAANDGLPVDIVQAVSYTHLWKITEEDWRNRDKYSQYKEAVEDMFRLTSTTFAPWTVLESDDKRHARVKALEIIVEALEARLHETRVSGTMGGANLSDRARQKRLT